MKAGNQRAAIIPQQEVDRIKTKEKQRIEKLKSYNEEGRGGIGLDLVRK